MADNISVGLRRMFPILGVGILVGICVLAGFLALIVGAIVVYCMLWLAVPVAVVERPGVVASLKRSRELTHGSKWSIFGIVLVLGVMQRIVDEILEKVLLPDPREDLLGFLDAFHAYLWTTLGAAILFGALFAVTSAVAYHDLRAQKEGVGIDELVSVFE